MRKDGGPAFPGGSYINQDHDIISDGMTLRDWFAGHIVSGMFASMTGDDKPGEREMLARIAYVFADALLKAREEKL